MDEIDFIILKKLLENSRLTYRELAEMIGMSIAAIHKRISKLEKKGIITAYIGRPTGNVLRYLIIVIFGTSNAKSVDSVSKELGQHESVESILIGGGKSMVIVGFLRDISELQEFSNFISKSAHISEPIVGIVNWPFKIPESLTTIDYKILKSLNKDARKSITEIADDVGISSKTVRKRLDRMKEYNLARFTIQWSPLQGENFITLFFIYLNEGTDVNSTVQYLYEKYSQNVINCLSYSNIPNFITFYIWSKTAHDSYKIQEKLQNESFKDIIPLIGIKEKYYDCWIDQLLRTK